MNATSANDTGAAARLHRTTRPSSHSSDEDSTSDAGVKKSADHQRKTRPFVYVLTGLSAIGGFLFGYDTGVVSGAMLLIRVEYRLRNDPVWQELIVSATIAAAWIFSLVGGYLVDAFGRKPVILCASFVFAAGGVIMGASSSKELLLFGRIVVGIGIGLISCSVPVYVAESAPRILRGKLINVYAAMMAGGQFSGAMIAAIFATSDPSHGWRFMLGLSGVPAVIQLIGFLGMPESPRWLVKKGQRDRAAAVLRSIRGDDADVAAEIESIRQSCDEAEDELQGRSVIVEILRTPSVRRALLVGCALQVFQQLAGINTVMYYSATIIQMAGVSSTSMAVWISAGTAGINFLFTFVGLYLVEKVGRRPLTLGSLTGVICSLILLAVGFQLAAMNSPDASFTEQSLFVRNDTCAAYRSCTPCTDDSNCGFCYEAVSNSGGGGVNGSCVSVLDVVDVDSSWYGRCSNMSVVGQGGGGDDHPLRWSHGFCPTLTEYKVLLIFALCIYLVFFAPGMGPMPWTVNSEIYPLWARGTCYAISTSFNWLFNLIVAMTFLSLTDALTKYGAFYLYAGISLVGLAFFFVAQPETRGKSLEEVEGLFARPLCCGSNVRGGGGGGVVPAVFADRTVQYVHIRGLNVRDRQDSNDSGDDT